MTDFKPMPEKAEDYSLPSGKGYCIYMAEEDYNKMARCYNLFPELVDVLEKIKTAFLETEFDYQMSEYMQKDGLVLIGKALSKANGEKE